MNTSVTTPAKTVLDSLGINENTEVSTSDVIDVFVARQEQHLHTLLAQAQERLKGAKSFLESVKVQIRSELSQDLKRAFPNTTVGPAFTLKYSHNSDKINIILDKPNDFYATADIVVEHVFDEMQSMQFRNHYDREKNTDHHKQDLHLELDLSGVMCIELQSCIDNISNCQTDINTINTELKSMGRKVRQLRGVIAERKLQARGIDDMVNDPSISLLMVTPTLLSA